MASVWVKARDLAAKGFGSHAGDAAGLLIQELDGLGAVRLTHRGPTLTQASDWKKLEVAFTAQPETRAVRFVLDTVIGCAYDQGSVTYDDGALQDGGVVPEKD